MKKRLIATTIISISAFALMACSQNTQEKVADVAESTKTDIAQNTATVAKEAEKAAQNVAEATKNGVQVAADKTSEAAKEVGAMADAVTNPNSAESQVSENQKY